MDFGLSEEQQQLKISAREFLADKCSTAAVRKAMASDDGRAPELEREIAKLGWTGLIVPEKFGGAGLGMLDMAVILEEQGYAAMPGPFLFSSAIAADALARGGSDELNRKWLGAIADGSAAGTIAIVEDSDSLSPADLATVAKKEGASARISGVKMFVPYGAAADFIVVAARSGGLDAALYVVDAKAAGVRVTALQNLDQTRRVARVEFDGAVAAPLAGGAKLYSRTLDIGAVAIAADSLGGIERALDMAVDYSKVREQFGKPIGSFQALKHAAAEILSEFEPGRALLWYAAYAQDAAPDAASRTASMAKARLCDVYMRGADRAVLMHGGIGFTWEHDIHLWFKRARFNEAYFGSPAYHRECVAQLGDY
ncbi:MAG TPA: acyl-CoA dehydrogenase family protein [Candidatus Binataceae bacterium]|nr:acyl-CoA dehydrogenase family protein [Candidatus Binataceae bacterium]